MKQGEKFIHVRVFTQKFSRDVMFTPSVIKYKSHKETCIHTRGRAKEENLEKVE